MRPDDPGAPPSEPLSERVVEGLAKLGLALRSQAWEGASAQGLTPTQGQILTLLRSRPEGLRLSQVAEGIAVSAPTASEAVAALVEKGLVRKDRGGDLRSLRITLTARGQEHARQAASWPDFLLDAVEELTSDERERFLRALVKMIRTLQERRQIPVSRMCVTCVHFRARVHADPAKPHHCAFVDAPFGDAELRLDCADHVTAERGAADREWDRFSGEEPR